MSYQRIVRPDYTVGTITLVSGSKNFTTVGASLKTATIGSGDTIMTADGRVLIISEITEQNAGVLAYPCPASAAGTNLPLLIRFQPSFSGQQAAIRDLLQRWGLTGNIDAIAGLETAKDMLSYFTGAGTADVTALTAFARTLLDDADAAAALTTLGFSSFMRGQTNANSFAGWGLANANNAIPSDNLNNLRINGVYRSSASTIGTPNGFIHQVLHMGQSQNYATQVAFPITQSPIAVPYRRILYDNTWSEWQPLGVQRGSNANGDFVKFDDGTQICQGYLDLDATTVPSAGSYTFPIAFPASFTSNGRPRVTFDLGFAQTNSIAFGSYVKHGFERYPTVSGTSFFVNTSGSFTTTVQVCWVAIGKWRD